MTAIVASHSAESVAFRQTEAVRMLGISMPTWHRMRRAGRAPSPDISYGRTRLYTKETLDKWLASKNPQAPSS
jgi:predicted site-specific integrase-resolvase